MREVDTKEAPPYFIDLLSVVEGGEEIVIMRGGKEVARLVPPATEKRRHFDAASRQMEALRRECRLDGLSLREMIDEGRRS